MAQPQCRLLRLLLGYTGQLIIFSSLTIAGLERLHIFTSHTMRSAFKLSLANTNQFRPASLPLIHLCFDNLAERATQLSLL